MEQIKTEIPDISVLLALDLLMDSGNYMYSTNGTVHFLL